MSQIAMMAAELLCHLTFAPADGRDPEDTATLVNTWWQTLIHDLAAPEREKITRAMQELATDLESRRPLLADHEQAQLETLRGFVSGDLS